MKHLKKLMGILVVMSMMFAMTMGVFAADTYTIKIKNSETGHVYEAYQIFTGSLLEETAGEGDKAVTTQYLSQIQWGSGVSAAGQTDLGNAEAVAKTLTSVEEAEKFADKAGEYLTTAAGSDSAPDDAGYYEISGLTAGYYLIKDKNDSLNNTNKAYTEYILKVVSDVEAEPKTGVVDFQKKVKDINDSKDTAYTGWQDSADFDIEDKVPFQLQFTLPGNFMEYTNYELVLHDKESAGLTYQKDAKVYIDGVELKTGFTVVEESLTDDCTFEVRFDNLRKTAAKNGSVITVEYTSLLNDGAVVGKGGNPNTLYATYSNNPNGSGTGKTAQDTVIVFTYQAVINKVDNANPANPLPGADFKLEKLEKGETDSWELVNVTKNDERTTFTFKGLDDGIYRLTETATPSGYNSIDPIYFEVTATHTQDGDNPARTLTALTAVQRADETGAEWPANKDATFEATVSVDEGSFESDIVNHKGVVLPSTGGMGTTIIYIAGAVLAIGAAVLMITKKRMENEK